MNESVQTNNPMTSSGSEQMDQIDDLKEHLERLEIKENSNKLVQDQYKTKPNSDEGTKTNSFGSSTQGPANSHSFEFGKGNLFHNDGMSQENSSSKFIN